MSLHEQNHTCNMEIFKTQLKIAADVFDKMPTVEQIKALDFLKELFTDLQSSLNNLNRNQAKIINADISLIEQDLINSIVAESSQDDLLHWNSSQPEINSVQFNDVNQNTVEHQNKDCLPMESICSMDTTRESFAAVDENDGFLNNIHKTSAIEENCDIQCNKIDNQDENTVENNYNGHVDNLGLCNSSVDVNVRPSQNKGTKSLITRSRKSGNKGNCVATRMSQRLAEKKEKKIDENVEVTSTNEVEMVPERKIVENGTCTAANLTNEAASEEDNNQNDVKNNEENVKSKVRKTEKKNCEFEEKTKTAQREEEENEEKKKPKETLECKQCDIQFTHAQHFRKHMNGHNRNNCKLCNAQFAKRKQLCRHLRTVHLITEAEKFYHCPHCERKFIKRPSLYVHLKEHADGKIVCMKCGLMCESKEHFSKHSKKHSEEAKFHCDRCDESFQRRQQYEQHAMGHEKYDCTQCDINFSTKKHLVKHKRMTHGILTREEKKHTCFICQKRFQRPMLLEIHMRLHTGEKPIQCTHCDKNFRTPKALAKHMKTAAHLKACGQDESEANELEKPYLCAQCGSKFYRRQGLIRHMQQLHSEERPYTCPYCEYSCKCKTNLKRHIELHTDQRRFICELCGASFHARATLKEHHAYVHSEDRNFVCSVCGKGFKGRSGLRRHVRIHSDARPYVCYCTQSYKRMSHLKRHMISIHGALFKSKRVSKIGDENSQSSCSSNFHETKEEERKNGDEENALILTVQNAVVEMLQNISTSSQEFIPSEDLLIQGSGNTSNEEDNNSYSTLSNPQNPLPQPPAQIFSSDFNHDFPLTSSTSPDLQSDANQFTFCMSLSQNAFNLNTQPFSGDVDCHQVFQASSLNPLPPPSTLLMRNLQRNSEKGEEGVPNVFAHSPC